MKNAYCPKLLQKNLFRIFLGITGITLGFGLHLPWLLVARGRQENNLENSFENTSKGSKTSTKGTQRNDLNFQFPKQISSPQQQETYTDLKQAEKLSQSYPKLRIFLSLLQAEKLKETRGNQIWNEPSLYEIFYWLRSFSAFRILSQYDLQSLAQNFSQLFYSIGDLSANDSGDSRELGRIYIKDYFERIANSPYPGQGSWLVLRIFIDPIREFSRELPRELPSRTEPPIRRIRIIYNALSAQNPPQVAQRNFWLLHKSSPMQRSSLYPQPDALSSSQQYAYFIPHPFSPLDNQAKTGALLPPPAGQPSQKKNIRYRLSFIAAEKLSPPENELSELSHQPYDTATLLQILRNYLRDQNIENDRLVPSKIRMLNKNKLDSNSYFLIQELIFYYYLLYLPERCKAFIIAQQQWKLNQTSQPIQNLWRIQIPKMWAAIDTISQPHNPDVKTLLPG